MTSVVSGDSSNGGGGGGCEVVPMGVNTVACPLITR
jgi:hypothetical protein